MSIFKSAFFQRAVLKGLIWVTGFIIAYGLDCLGQTINGFRCMDIVSWLACTYISARLLYLQIEIVEECRELERF